MKRFCQIIFHHRLKTIIFLTIFISVSNVYCQENRNIRLEQLLEELINCPSNGEGMSKREVAISDSIKSIGTEAVPPLIKLLKHQNHKVQERASFTIAGIDGINEGHLDALIESLKNGQTWHANRIAKIGTPKAIDALYHELVKDCKTETQLTHSFVTLGEKGIPYLLNAFDCQGECNESFLYVVSTIFEKLGVKGQSAVGKLDSLAFSASNSITSRKWAITCLGYIGSSENSIAEKMYKLAFADSIHFRKVITDALQYMKAPEAVLLLLERLDKSKEDQDKILALRDIAEMGKNAHSAGNEIMQYLKDENWEVRTVTAVTLGLIGYVPAVEGLIEALNFEPSCKLNYAAAIALGRLGAKKAIEPLKKIEKTHWYPIVQETATEAIKSIEDSTRRPKTENEDSFHELFFSYENLGEEVPSCKLKSCTDEKRLTISSGYLEGSDRGEFGGELKFVDSKGNETIVLQENILSLYQFKGNIIAITGLCHMGINRGYIYKIAENTDGSLKIYQILELPGAPIETKKKANGELLINTQGGTVELTKDLKLKFCDCGIVKQ